jgi:hypothetical protein
LTIADDAAYRDLQETLDAGRADLVPLLACVASGLGRLPSFRGAAVRPAGAALGEVAGLLLPGEELGEAMPISGVALDKGYPTVAADHYLIWSMTGRRASSLLGDPESRVGAADNSAPPTDEIVFAPGTRFRYLAVEDRGGATVVLLRQLADTEVPESIAGQLGDSDLAVLQRLRTLKEQPAVMGLDQIQRERFIGRLGVLGVPNRPTAHGTDPVTS